ncbi:MAG TPA: hypothetical protein VGY55_09480 [Pirellulales bacterium]|nr:hypothetical protein [Pirellulales bacterium]
MFRHSLLRIVAVVVLASEMGAGPKDDLQSAIKQLADSANYSWSSTVDGGFAGRKIEGRIEKDGPVSLTINYGDDAYGLIIIGDKAAAKGAAGWASTADLERSADEEGDAFGPERFLLSTIRNFKSPAEQAKDLCDRLEAVQKSGDEYSADLSPDAAKQLLLNFRRRADNPDPLKIEVKNPNGSLKCWISDGRLTKMQVHVQGTLSSNGKDRTTDRTTTTEIKSVGSTKIEVPDEARAKL